MVAPLPVTFVHQLLHQAAALEDRPALWTKRGRAFEPTSWRQYARRVKELGLGLISLGVQAGERVAIMAPSREEWVVGALGTMGAGAVSVGLYTTMSAEQLEYVITHAEARVVIVESAAMLAQLPREKLKSVHTYVVMIGDGQGDGVISYTQLLERGRARDDAEFFTRLDAQKAEQLAVLIYTSGTTGHPKGVMLSHRNLVWTAVQLSTCAQVTNQDVLLSYLPLSHIAEQVCTMYGPLWNGLEVYFAESFERVPDNLREVRPTVFFGVPRVWEKFAAKIEAGLKEQPARRQRIVQWARDVATRFHTAELAHRQPGLPLELQFRLAQRLVFTPLKARIGLERCHIFACSAAPISRDVLDFMASFDIVIGEVYGQSEVTGPTSVNSEQATKLGTVGRPMPGVQVRIGADGEVLVRGENVCMGYYKDEAATRALLDSDGWMHSGDLGELDPEGFLRITGRKKEIIVTSGGKKTSPANIEARLKNVGPLGHALVVGEGRNYLAALLTLDAERVATFGKEHGLPTDCEALAASTTFRQLIEANIERDVTPHFSKFESIKRFEILPRDFSIDGGELTSTLKMRRDVIEKQYAGVIAKLYA